MGGSNVGAHRPEPCVYVCVCVCVATGCCVVDLKKKNQKKKSLPQTQQKKCDTTPDRTREAATPGGLCSLQRFPGPQARGPMEGDGGLEGVGVQVGVGCGVKKNARPRRGAYSPWCSVEICASPDVASR